MVNHPNRSKKKKLTDAERHRRFKDMAKEVGAPKKPEDFDRAFEKVTKPKPLPPRRVLLGSQGVIASRDPQPLRLALLVLRLSSLIFGLFGLGQMLGLAVCGGHGRPQGCKILIMSKPLVGSA